MIVNGKEIIIKPGQPEAIQRLINQQDDLKSDLKSEIEPEKVKGNNDDIYSTQDGMSELGFSLFDKKEDDRTRDRRMRYDYYREMDTTEFIHRALEIVADDSSQINQEGNAIKIYSDNEDLKVKLEELFIDKLDMNNELWSTIFETCKMGDNFYEVVVNDYKKPKNIIFLRYLEPEKVERIEKNGRLAYYLYKAKSLLDPGGASPPSIEANRTDQEIIYKLQPWQIIHFKIENKQFLPYGSSLLYSGLRTYRRLNLLEDVMLVYRLSRAPERRVFYIDVGNLNRIEAKRFLEKVKNSYRTQSFIDEDGNLNKRSRMLSITNDIFVPVREGSQGTRIDTLQGGEALHNIDDMKYFRDKILKTMNIPPAYLGDETDRSRGSLAQLDIKFSRFIERIQSQIIRGLNKIAALELFFAGYKKEDLNDFEIELTPPSNIKEVTEIDLMGQKISLLSNIQQLSIFSNRWMLKNVLKMSDAEIADIELYKSIEAQGQPPEGMAPGIGGGALPSGLEGGALPPGEEEIPNLGTEAPPGETATTGETQPAELAASTMINLLGREFIVENKEDFGKILNFIKEQEKKNNMKFDLSQIADQLSEVYHRDINKKPETNNIKRLFIVNELGGLNFEVNGKIKRNVNIWEGVVTIDTKTKEVAGEYKEGSIVVLMS